MVKDKRYKLGLVGRGVSDREVEEQSSMYRENMTIQNWYFKGFGGLLVIGY